MFRQSLLALILCALVSCRPRSDSSVAKIVANPDTNLTKTYQGNGFLLAVPGDADSGQANKDVWGFDGIELRGPLVLGGGGTGHAYFVLVTSLANPGHLSVDKWIDSLRRERNKQLMDDSLNFLYPPDTLAVNGQRVLRLRPFCGDCQPYEYYFGSGTRIVLLKYIDGGLEAWPRAQAAHMAERIIHTFKWN